MNMPQISNLEINYITKDVLLIHQIKTPYYFSCCDGIVILRRKERNKQAIALDLNIEPNLIDEIDQAYGPFSNYVCTHGHMDHMAHVYHWEDLGVNIYAPIPENTYLLDLVNFYQGFRFDEGVDHSLIEKFAKYNKYHSCKVVNPFKPGVNLHFENLTVETISFSGHSRGHIGLLLPHEKILHISCLGFDIPHLGKDGFGPWYGFKECSITKYLEDINLAEKIFLQRAEFLTSSHSYIIKHPDTTPFAYMRNKIKDNQTKVDQALSTLKIRSKEEINMEELLNLDIFFPKSKLQGFIVDLYRFWESYIIDKHLKRSKYFQKDAISNSS